ncbi:MAG: hypothetical protein Q4G22_10950 [Paracoccus sp. (in: a-proteobacteria)]|uniref:hypothetical protein n=1 Tax=Paracoccus sp. TaxID=267 RepID=UPI0026DFAAF1|nr:hypothetical protein [Paracoccus sp. (in: a-proteobacteria)]MDO5632343.1 hypothetical protein [Paracoccus sp. (in: a-proteobacteria)]
MQWLAETAPEAALLRLDRKLDLCPSVYWHGNDVPDVASDDLSTLHQAIRNHAPLCLDDTNLKGNESERAVLPLTLVRPPQGIKLLV